MSVKKKVTFFERNSWYHRTKTLKSDHTVKYGKLGGFKTEKEAEESHKKLMDEFEKNVAKTLIKNKYDVTFKDYLLFWFENVYSIRVESSSEMLGAYTLYNLIIPKIEQNIKLRYTNSDYLDALFKRSSKICDSAGNKSRELLYSAFNDAKIDGFINFNPVERNKTL